MSFPAPLHEQVRESGVDPLPGGLAVASRDSALEATASPARSGREWHGLTAGRVALLSVIAAAMIGGRLTMNSPAFPAEDLRIPVGSWFESATNWFIENMGWFYDPIASTLASGLEQLDLRLELAPGPQIAALLVILVFCARGFPLALLTAGTLTWCVATSVWEETLQTLAFMIIAVSISCVLGITLGIVASLGRRLESLLRAALDGMQAFPIFAYLVPVVLIFGPGDVGAMVVTIVWATPPVARMTIVGLRGVPEEIVESAQSFGANRWQLLVGVRLPLARMSIFAGINQTIMFAISMATLAAIIGGSGLGQVTWGGLTRLDFGDAVAGGLALVLCAVILDRATAPRNDVNPRSRKSASPARSRAAEGLDASRWHVPQIARAHPRWAAGGLLALVAMIITTLVPSIRLANLNEPPEWLAVDTGVAIEHAVNWTTVHLGSALDSIRTNVSLYGLNPVLDVLRWIPWPAMVLLGLVAGYALIGVRAAILVGGGIYLIGAMGMWEATTITVAVVSVSVAMAVVIGFPIGVAMSRSDRLNTAIRPLLDLAQTVPVFLFVIPAVIFMGTGQVTGAIATVGFALPPLIRLTNVALRNADAEVVEAARSFGATERQILLNVRAPLGLPTILVGLNQTVLLALAMAVVAAFVGTPGLGEEILVAINGGFFAPGVEAGLSMFILVLIFDRLFRAWTTRLSIGAHLKVR